MGNCFVKKTSDSNERLSVIRKSIEKVYVTIDDMKNENNEIDKLKKENQELRNLVNRYGLELMGSLH